MFKFRFNTLGVSAQNPSKQSSTLAVYIFGLIFIAVSLIAFWFLGQKAYQENQSFFWSENKCQIKKLEFSFDRSSSYPYRLHVFYQKTPLEQLYSEQMQFDRFRKVRPHLRSFQANTFHPCYFNPENSLESTLLRGNFENVFLTLIPIPFLLVGLFVIRVARSISGESKKSRMAKHNFQISRRSKTIISSVLFVGSSITGWYLVLEPYQKLFASASWLATEAEIQVSQITESNSDDGTTYGNRIIYRYQYAGDVFYAEQITFFDYSSSNYSHAQNIANRYPEGAKVKVHFDPEDPVIAVLDPQLSPYHFLFALIPAFLFLASVLVFRFTLKPDRNLSNKQQSRFPEVIWLPSLPIPLRTASGGYALVAETSLRQRFLGYSIGFCLLFGLAIILWRSGTWMMAIIFGIIGFFLLLAALRNLLLFFSPSMQLEVADWPLKPGQSSKIFWHLNGNLKDIEKITIHLQLEERATYQRGTDTKTETKIVVEEECLILQSSQIQKRGEVQFSLPENCIHSFHTNNNKLVWQLAVRIYLKNYPDWNEQYKLLVIPV